MDYRLDDAIREYLVSLGKQGDYDLVSMAGACKELAQSCPGAEVLRTQVRIATRLHGVSELIIIHHTDCGAYGGRDAFNSAEAERDQHVHDMRQSANFLKKEFPEITVVMVLARIHDDQSVDFERIF